MVFSEQALMYWMTAWFLPFARIAATFTAAPFFSARGIPMSFRLIMALAISVMIFPHLPPAPSGLVLFSWAGLMALGQQILIGLAMGFMLQMMFAAVTVAGEAIAMGMGLGFAVMMDPQSGVQVPVLAQYYLILTTLLFLVMGGHLAFLNVLFESFQLLPVGESLARAGIWQVVNWVAEMFAGGVLIALPVLLAILVVNLAFGVISRAAPQLNIFAVGFPVTLLIGMLLVVFNWPGQVNTIESLLDQVLLAIPEVLRLR